MNTANIINDMVKALDNNEITEEVYVKNLSNYKRLMELTFKLSMENKMAPDFEDKRAYIENALNLQIQAFNLAIEYAKTGDKSLIEDALLTIKDSIDEFNDILEKTLFHRLVSGPTKVPFANNLINTITIMLERNLGDNFLDPAIELLKTNLDELKEKIRSLKDDEIEDPALLESKIKSQKAVDDFDNLLNELKIFKDNRDIGRLENIRENAIRIGQSLSEASEIIKDYKISKNMLMCVKCGHPNPKESHTCSKCNFGLPQKTDDVADYMDIPMGQDKPKEYTGPKSEISQTLINTILAAKEGKIDDGQFIASIKQVSYQVENLLTETPSVDLIKMLVPQELQNSLTEADLDSIEDYRELFMQYLQQIKTGLLELEKFSIDHNQQHLNDGIDIIANSAHILAPST